MGIHIIILICYILNFALAYDYDRTQREASKIVFIAFNLLVSFIGATIAFNNLILEII